MDFLEIIGTIIGIGGILVYIVLYKIFVSKKTKKNLVTKLILFILLIASSLTSVAFWQKAQDIRKYTFTQQEINLINTIKPYEELTEEEKQLFVVVLNKYLLNDEEKVAQYKDKIFNLDVERYIYDNKHLPDKTLEDAQKFVTKDWKSRREFNIEND